MANVSSINILVGFYKYCKKCNKSEDNDLWNNFTKCLYKGISGNDCKRNWAWNRSWDLFHSLSNEQTTKQGAKWISIMNLTTELDATVQCSNQKVISRQWNC